MGGRPGCLALAFFALVLLLPFFLANAMLTALARLGLSPETSLLAAVGIFMGGVVNIPVKKIPREEIVEIPALPLFGLGQLLPRVVRRRTHTVIAVNVGGCLVPLTLVAYELWRLAGMGWGSFGLALVAAAVNTAVCWKVARPIPRVGIAMPALVPALVAALTALLLLPEMAPPVAFVAGVLGPLVGADLLHFDDVKEIGTGMASIGGAGTFDGIVLSGLVATLLA
ncbi:MAG: DUF1614 domain-containing protein [Gemmatimonadetes bacterium]|nr:DUF1614 domain-containing protein [Gemmatimonadota bacterium]NIR79540.1 DUF1614 domain-containing protein [Gemmatimonadota bacterium]NIT88216.1 DUF1614 domain-containing protein [Gemmatimonadota bacterium]NIU32024.1 DUF1614 domain-containing protein [Gemmatimonadota bacterium]NIU36633.1 DUF1614 domain-containing protein [Gemmatimonadota bacterium]